MSSTPDLRNAGSDQSRYRAVTVESRPWVGKPVDLLQTPGGASSYGGSSDVGTRFAMTVTDHLEALLPQGRAAPRGARDHVDAFLDAQDLDGDVKQRALVIASELVTNAVVHAGEPITLELALRRDDVLRVEVRDGDEHIAVVARRPEDRGVFTGRGLMIVESLAQQWGVRCRPGGKSVWADIDVSPGEHTDLG